MTELTVARSDAAVAYPIAAEAEHLAGRAGDEDTDRYALKVELAAIYGSDAEHGRALASLLLAVHRWVEEQEAECVDVVLDGRRFTIRAPEDEDAA